MPFFLLIPIAVLILGSLSFRWQRRRRALKNAEASLLSEQFFADATPPLSRRVTHKLATLRSKLPFATKQPALAQRFSLWTNMVLPADDQLLIWLNSLSPEASTAFTQQVAEFCTEMGFELDALVDGQLEQVPSAAQQAKQIVLHYGYANHEAARAGADFMVSKRFLIYLQAPFSKTNRVFGQKLYRKLVDKEIVPAPSFEMLLASEEKRRVQSLAAIRTAAAEQPTAFTLVLTEVIAESELIERKPKLIGLLKRSSSGIGMPPLEPLTPADLGGEYDESADAPMIITA